MIPVNKGLIEFITNEFHEREDLTHKETYKRSTNIMRKYD